MFSQTHLELLYRHCLFIAWGRILKDSFVPVGWQMPLKRDRKAQPLLDRKLAIHVLKSLEADVMIATIHVGRQENSLCN